MQTSARMSSAAERLSMWSRRSSGLLLMTPLSESRGQTVLLTLFQCMVSILLRLHAVEW